MGTASAEAAKLSQFKKKNWIPSAQFPHVVRQTEATTTWMSLQSIAKLLHKKSAPRYAAAGWPSLSRILRSLAMVREREDRKTKRKHGPTAQF